MKPATLLGPLVVPDGNGDPLRGGIDAGRRRDGRSATTDRYAGEKQNDEAVHVATSSKTPESYRVARAGVPPP
jgi:hypothetical protein